MLPCSFSQFVTIIGYLEYSISIFGILYTDMQSGTKTTMELEKSTIANLKEVGKKSQTYDDLINQRITCNATGCNAIGTIELKVSAGKFGTVTLFVCVKCVGKFLD
jgi:hypothetical protein